ncbi:phosphoenolpyruvate--protein phosphotransferase [Bremerella cremea]|uniref:Phosphoenolpyruvate-protein phosphotransferase n=1 Tax=Blastopirellula marina TaxID=124 RepID=A0A2S8FJ17_9BACT|nr:MULTISPECIES: phosphoenolpyruvate--protein phosphotransferase [Pirellulaceae]PQO32151.1 phosphoenolpyruvate--protein phosphotransferase [Blastopirellula marina]RCS45217.1 phosphoenolpyruvate--protein phosphotransferase [Bremerella cremea]
MEKGLAVSPGIAIGVAYCILEIFVNPDRKRLEEHEVNKELARYEQARERTAVDLAALQAKVEEQIGKNEAAIFAVHQTILRDPAFTNKVRHWIVEERVTAAGALHRLLEEYTSIFSKTGDEYLQERLNDIRDVVVRLSAYLSDVLNDKEESGLSGPLIVIADELLPSQAVALGEADVHGIVTQAGSQTSHAALIARSRGIPAVSGVSGLLSKVKTGDTVVVNGSEGIVSINPESEELAAYRKLEREFFDLKDQLAANRDQPAVTRDGTELKLLANINNAKDVESAVAMGAQGVGLYRTEYLYLTHENVPDENEQFAVYREILQKSPRHYVTIRTLDIGGDKTVAYLGHNHNEANPFMGWRSIRLSFEHPEFFMSQIRAIMRCAAELKSGEPGEVNMLFPMITNVEEMRKARHLVRKAEKSLDERGIPRGEVKVGMMLEVPAAAVAIHHLLELVDFVSIGSNDLVQYLTAADRDNPKVSGLCQPLSPAVVITLKHVIEACNQANIPVTLCGEMAGQPRAFLLLLGMGLRSFSMSPAFIPTIKELANQATVEHAERVVEKVMEMKTTNQVKRYLRMELEAISPDIARLDTE